MSKVRWYVVIRPDWCHIFHTNWDLVRPYINKISNVKYKGFDSERGAKLWMSSFLMNDKQMLSLQSKSVPIQNRIIPSRHIKIQTRIAPSRPNTFDAYTDGSYLFKTSSGGWAYVLVSNDRQNVICSKSGHLPPDLKIKPTNNRAELLAILNLIVDFPNLDLNIYSDSQYSIKSITIWSNKWKKNGWKTSKNLPVENRDFIERIINLISDRYVRFFHVKAHNGDHFNEIVDKLAREAAQLQ